MTQAMHQILVIEDEPAIRNVLRVLLEAEGYRFIEADTQQLPFPDNAFQLVVVAFGLRNVTDTDKGIAEMVRVTQPGGRVAILEFLDTDAFNISLENCVAFLDPMIDSWDIDLKTFAIGFDSGSSRFS